MLNVEKAPTSEAIELFPCRVVDALKKFSLRQSIVNIRQMTQKSDTFEYHLFDPAEV